MGESFYIDKLWSWSPMKSFLDSRFGMPEKMRIYPADEMPNNPVSGKSPSRERNALVDATAPSFQEHYNTN